MKIAKLPAFVLFVVVIATTCSAHDGYDRLNQHLENNVATKDLEENLKEVQRLLDLTQDSEETHDPVLLDALYDFGELSFFHPKNFQCDETETSALAKLSAHVKVHKFNPHPHPEDQMTRIEWIVYKRSLEHAQMCLPNEYLRIFRETGPLSEDVVKYTGYYTHELLKRKPDQTTREYMEWLAKLEPPGLNVELDHTVKHIKNRSMAMYGFYNRWTAEAYNNFLKRPCKSYVRAYGQWVFEPAKFDLEMFENLESAYDLDDEELLDYFLSMATYRICKGIVNNQELEQRVINELSQGAKGSSSSAQI